MRPCRFGPLLLLVACGDPSDTPMTASAGVTTVTTSSSTGASTSGGATAEPTPTTTDGSATAATDATAGSTTADETTGTTTTGTTGTSEPASGTSTTGDTAASESATTTTTTGDGTATTTTGDSSDGTTADPCPIGQDGCPCGQNASCDPGLACEAGLCGPPAPPVCGDGDVEGNEQCDDGNKISGDGCENNCTPTPMPATDPCGFESDGVWLEIDYSNAFTSTNPGWTYSPTPGWGEPEWAPQGESWPEVWDIYQNVEVDTDAGPLGKVAIVDSNGALQIMFGIGGLTYDYATVCVQGRSYSVGSSVTFTVQNQLNKCGDTGMMANDWSVHSTGVDLGTCIVDNNEFQGLRIFASGGSGALSLKRLRFTLHGAIY